MEFSYNIILVDIFALLLIFPEFLDEYYGFLEHIILMEFPSFGMLLSELENNFRGTYFELKFMQKIINRELRRWFSLFLLNLVYLIIIISLSIFGTSLISSNA